MLMGWMAALVGGIVLVLRGMDRRNKLLIIAGSLLIAAVTLLCAYSFF
jgi:hypothetical protein